MWRCLPPARERESRLNESRGQAAPFTRAELPAPDPGPQPGGTPWSSHSWAGSETPLATPATNAKRD